MIDGENVYVKLINLLKMSQLKDQLMGKKLSEIYFNIYFGDMFSILIYGEVNRLYYYPVDNNNRWAEYLSNNNTNGRYIKDYQMLEILNDHLKQYNVQL